MEHAVKAKLLAQALFDIECILDETATITETEAEAMWRIIHVPEVWAAVLELKDDE